MNRQSVSEYIFTRKRWLLHIFFWVVILVFYAIIFGRQNSNYLQTLFFIGLLLPVTIGTAYFLSNYLVPRFLLKERYGYFMLYFLYTIIGSLLIEMSVAYATFIVMAGWRVKNMSPASIDLVFLLISLLMVVFLVVAIKLLMSWRKSREEYQKLMHEKAEAELKFLKTQLNPHFLFNTLNNLYLLTLEKSDQAPKAILALSEILDYVLHSSNRPFVRLAEEWKQTLNFIELELLRYGERVHVEKSVNGAINQQTVCPMVLITLIENAFKHGVMPNVDTSWVRLRLTVSEEFIHVNISNSLSSTENQSGGIGLANLRSQLRHVYGEHHTLQITASSKSYSVTLQIPAHGKI